MRSIRDYMESDDRAGDGLQSLVDDIRYVARQAVIDEVNNLPPMFQGDLADLDARLKAVERRLDLLHQAAGRE